MKIFSFSGQTGASETTMPAALDGNCESKCRGDLSENLSSLHGVCEKSERQEYSNIERQWPWWCDSTWWSSDDTTKSLVLSSAIFSSCTTTIANRLSSWTWTDNVTLPWRYGVYQQYASHKIGTLVQVQLFRWQKIRDVPATRLVNVKTLSDISGNKRGSRNANGIAGHCLRVPPTLLWRDFRVFCLASKLLFSTILLGVRRHWLLFWLAGAFPRL